MLNLRPRRFLEEEKVKLEFTELIVSRYKYRICPVILLINVLGRDMYTYITSNGCITHGNPCGIHRSCCPAGSTLELEKN